ETARQKNTPLRALNVDFQFRYEPAQLVSADTPATQERRARVQVTTWRRPWPWLELSLLGEHQAVNAAVALAAVDTLCERGWQIQEQAVAAGLASVQWPSRIEIVGRSPWVVLDCAHNTASAEALVGALTEVLPPARRVLVFASSSDKEVSAILRILAPY